MMKVYERIDNFLIDLSSGSAGKNHHTIGSTDYVLVANNAGEHNYTDVYQENTSVSIASVYLATGEVRWWISHNSIDRNKNDLLSSLGLQE